MTFASIICVLLLEQLKASPGGALQRWLSGVAIWLENRFNRGGRSYAVLAWLLAAPAPALVVAGAAELFAALHPVAGFLFGVGILYLSMGFRLFSRHFKEIQTALGLGEIDKARLLMTRWSGRSAEGRNAGELAALAIGEGVICSHRHVFAPLLWFMLLGPAGAVLYACADIARRQWTALPPLDPTPAATTAGSDFGRFAVAAFQFIDWLPARVTAVTFALVGDFEDAVYCWRTQAAAFADAAVGVLLASAAGALGFCLGSSPAEDDGGAVGDAGAVADDAAAWPRVGVGDEPEVEHLQAAFGLVWRALLVCLLLLALLVLAL